MLKLHDFNKIQEILRVSTTIAVVGFSPKEKRPSNMVGRYLMDAGYTVIPVNPGHDEICGLSCYPSLSKIPEKIDVVDIFRRAEDVFPVVEEAVRIGAKIIWMQQGIVNEDAARYAQKHGLFVVMDRCIKIEHQKSIHAHSNMKQK